MQDDEVLESLKSQDPPTGLMGWLRLLFARLFVHDVNAVISQHEQVMHIHSSGEDFDNLAESCFVNIQVTSLLEFCFKGLYSVF